VSAARATQVGATLAVGDDIARSLVLTRLGVVILGLVTVLVAGATGRRYLPGSVPDS
jgi:hypothetical protein